MNVKQNMIITENITKERTIRKEWELRQRTVVVEDHKRWLEFRDNSIAERESAVEEAKLTKIREKEEVAAWAAKRDANEVKPKGQRDWEAKVAHREQVAAAREDAKKTLGRMQQADVKEDPALRDALATLRSRVDHLEKTKIVFDYRKSAV